MLAWAETERYNFNILGVTDVCRAQVGVRTGYRAACSGYGPGAGTRERVENPSVETCALRGACERGEKGVRELARRVQIEAQSHAKDCKSTLARMRQCTRSEHERRTTSDCHARAVMNPVLTMEPCYFHFVWSRVRCRMQWSQGGTRRQRTMRAAPPSTVSPMAQRPRSLER